jgi:hypothetical protein
MGCLLPALEGEAEEMVALMVAFHRHVDQHRAVLLDENGPRAD